MSQFKPVEDGIFISPQPTIATLADLAKLANYSLMDTLNCDPDATANGADHAPRQVFTGHYVPVNPTPIKDPEYVAHSKTFFRELGFADSMALSADFVRMFSGDISQVSGSSWHRSTCTRSACQRHGLLVCTFRKPRRSSGRGTRRARARRIQTCL